MATYSSILAWEIPWTEESGGLESMGSQKLDTVTKPSPVQGSISSVLDEASFPGFWMRAILLYPHRAFPGDSTQPGAGFSFFPFPVPFPSSSSSSPFPSPYPSFSFSPPTVLTHQGGSPLMTSSKPNYLPEAPPPNTILLGVKFSTCGCGGTGTFSPKRSTLHRPHLPSGILKGV